MKKILVVDDDTDILSLVQMTLTMHKFEVEAIPRWEDIDSRIDNFHPDLILLDVYLVGADGRQICKKIKGSESTRHIPIILFSANAEMGNDLQACGADAFLAKPYNLAALLETINFNLNPGSLEIEDQPVS